MHVMTVSARVRRAHCAGISRPSPVDARRGPRNSHRFDGLEALVLTLAVSRTENSRLSALRADFSMSESMRLASKVARLARPAPQLASASPVFLVALGFSDDRGLFFQDCSSRD